MNPGLYDRTITIKTLTTSNEDGATIETFAAAFTDIPAWVKSEKANESVEAEKMEYQQKRIFQVPYLGDSHGIDGNAKIIYETKDYNVESIEEIGRQRAHLIVGRLND